MSKKKNKKFKAHHHQPTYQPAVSPVAPSVQSTGNATVTTMPEAPVKEAPLDEISVLNKKYAYVRRDVGKLLIVLTSLAILFVAIYFLGTKTDILTMVGNWIYKIGHFSI